MSLPAISRAQSDWMIQQQFQPQLPNTTSCLFFPKNAVPFNQTQQMFPQFASVTNLPAGLSQTIPQTLLHSNIQQSQTPMWPCFNQFSQQQPYPLLPVFSASTDLQLQQQLILPQQQQQLQFSQYPPQDSLNPQRISSSETQLPNKNLNINTHKNDTYPLESQIITQSEYSYEQHLNNREQCKSETRRLSQKSSEENLTCEKIQGQKEKLLRPCGIRRIEHTQGISNNLVKNTKTTKHHQNTQHISPSELALNFNIINPKLSHLLNDYAGIKQCSSRKLQSACNLQSAFAIVQSSPFCFKQDMLFSQKFSHFFQLQESNAANSEVVFSQIKESRRNNRNPTTTTTPPFVSSTILPHDETTVPDVSSPPSPKTKRISKPTSKFHNLKKLFMYKVIASFSIGNMIELKVPEPIRGILTNTINRIKISAKKSTEFKRNTEFFSQAHYSALFLILNEKTISQLAANPFEVYLHRLLFSIDLVAVNEFLQSKINNTASTPDLPISSESVQEIYQQIQYANIVKKYCFAVVSATNMMRNTNPAPTEQETMRMAYTFRALQGISSLSRGFLVKKF